MKFPLRSTVQIGKYVASQTRKGERYPLVLMLEPTLACNIACIGCGKIREYESNKARLTVEECIDAGAQCPAPVVSICGGEPLVYKGIEDVVAGMLELGKNIDLCTNALKLTEYLTFYQEKMGANSPLIQKVLAGKSPNARAVEREESASTPSRATRTSCPSTRRTSASTCATEGSSSTTSMRMGGSAGAVSGPRAPLVKV